MRQYIKGITVIVEEPLPKEMAIAQIELQRANIQQHQSQRVEIIPHTIKNEIGSGRQEIQLQRTEIQSQTSCESAPQMIITNGQLHNTTAQLINGQILTTSHGQPIIQTGAQLLQAGQIVHPGQIIQTGNNVQLIQQNGQPAQVVQIQRTGDGDRCEIIVQPDITGEAQYYEDGTRI